MSGEQALIFLKVVSSRKKQPKAGRPWFTPVILAILEAEIRKSEVRSQPGQIVHETLSQKKK
jgi:hypothetical protein